MMCMLPASNIYTTVPFLDLLGAIRTVSCYLTYTCVYMVSI